MPIYEYKCDTCGNVFELIQKFSDEPLKIHDNCGGHLEKLISRSALQFKGSGWYVTDYAKAGAKPESNGEGKKDSGSSNSSESGGSDKGSADKGSSDSKSDSKSESKSESKPESKSESKPATSTESKTESKSSKPDSKSDTSSSSTPKTSN